MVCIHHNDLDGRCAAAIVLKKYPDCRMLEVDYKDDLDFSKEVEKDEIVFIVDFSFKPEKIYELFKITAHTNIVWIDHHRTAKAYEYLAEDGLQVFLAGERDFSNPGRSGCVLTWQYLFPAEQIPWSVRWIGDRDTWAWRYGEITKFFTAGMLIEDTDPQNIALWCPLLSAKAHHFNELYASIKAHGEIVIKNRDMYAKAVREQLGFVSVWEDHRCYIINMPMASSEDFGEYLEAHLCLAIQFNGDVWKVSLRTSDPLLDVSEIAKKYGGGGHKGAAGFVCKKLPF